MSSSTDSIFYRETYRNDYHLSGNSFEQYWEDLYNAPSCGNLTSALLSYPLSMGGYAIAAQVRILGIFKEFLLLIAVICDRGDPLARGVPEIEEMASQKRAKHLFIFGMSFVEVGSAVIGIVLPPLAYKIDRYIYSFPTIRESGIFFPHEWEKISHEQLSIPQTTIEELRAAKDDQTKLAGLHRVISEDK